MSHKNRYFTSRKFNRLKKSFFKTAGIYSLLAVFLFTNFLPLRVWADETGSDSSSQVTTDSVVTTDASAPVTPDTSATIPSVETPSSDVPAVETPAMIDTVSTPDDSSLTTDDAKTDDAAAELSKDKGIQPMTSSGAPANLSLNKGDEQRKTLLPGIDEVTGALTYSYPLDIPKGRNGLQPDLKLNYNSQYGQEGDELGYGWNVSIPYIERINRKGFDQLYATTTTSYFNSSLSGELVSTGTSTWAAKVENGEFLNYTFSNNEWLVKDKSGTQYKFGYNAATQLVDPNDTSRVYRWMLEEVRDTNDNYITYAYSKDSNQIYPSTITYTGNGSTAGAFQIAFTKSLRPANDQPVSYKTAFSVQTKYRLTEIDAKVNNAIVHKYILGYTTGYNGNRSLLSTITESGLGTDSNWTTLPAVTFSYQTPGDSSFARDNNYTTGPVDTNAGIDVQDVNGDGYADIVQSWQNPSGQFIRNTYLNNADGTWSATTTAWIAPIKFFTSNTPNDLGVRSGDWNGDGYPDLAQHLTPYSNLTAGYMNNGTSSWATSTTYHGNQIPTLAYDNNSSDTGTRIVDLNGDGLPDAIQDDGSSQTPAVDLNIGTSWSGNGGWSVPTTTGAYIDFRQGTYIFDVNNDGLPDIVQAYYSNGGQSRVGTYLNTGNKTWVHASNWDFTAKYFSDAWNDYGFRPMDVNGDGLIDLSQSIDGVNASIHTYLNNGNGWTDFGGWGSSLPFAHSSGSGEPRTKLGDVNGDGLTDIFSMTDYGNATIPAYIYLNQAKKSDLLNSITYSQGGSTSVTYQATPMYKSGSALLNPGLPLNMDTVKQITTSDGLGQTMTTNYSYEGGSYYYNNAFDRKFAGFARIVKTNPDNTTEISYYHQGNGTATSTYEYDDQYAEIGKAYRVDDDDASGNLFKRTVTKWAVATSTNFVYPAQTIAQQYDGTANHADSAVTYSYDTTNGNLLDQYEWGTVNTSDPLSFTDTGTDNRTTVYNYASSSQSTVNVPSSVTLLDGSNNQAKQTKYYYDNLSFGSVDKGNNTETDNWISDTTYSTSSKAYNNFGLVTSETDPRGYATSYTYDAYNLYPATTTNPLSQTKVYIYDYASGQPTQVTDENSQVFKYTYDGLGRLLKEEIPNEGQLVESEQPGVKELYSTPLYADSNLVAYYRLNGNSNDAKGSNNGTDSNITYSSGNGKFDQGAGFNGTNSKIDLADNANLRFTGPFSVSIWFKSTVKENTIFSNLNTTSGGLNPYGGYLIRTNAGTGYLNIFVGDGIHDTGVSTSGNINVCDGSYHLLTYVFTGTAYKIYIDSVENVSNTNSTAPAYLANNYPKIGVWYSDRLGYNYWGTENIDDLALFNRALTPAEISNLYTGDWGTYTLTSTTSPLIAKRVISYSDTSNLSAHQLAYSHETLYYPHADTYALNDGLGRTVRMVKMQNNNALYSDTDYDSSGRIYRQSLLYQQSGFSFVDNGYGGNSSITTTYAYDALNRPITVSDANGTTTTAYSGNTTTVTDPESKVKSYTKDGLGRLVQVTENSNGSAYQTYYDYDAQDNLIKITDAENNIRNFAYDGLGRRTSVQDLHASGDQVYGSYSYQYDHSGNQTQTVTPKNDNILYTYDGLNRQLTEKLSGDTNPRISYTYDNCTNGQTRLCAVSNDAGPSYDYAYTANGQVATGTVMIPGLSQKATAYQYDTQGNNIKITLPDSSELTYRYDIKNPYNLPITVSRKAAGATSTTPVITAVSYNEAGQPTNIQYANGRTSIYNYDNAHKYRLNSIATDAPSSSYYQSTSYNWNPSGNLSRLTDVGAAGLNREVDYTYDDLYRLTGAKMATSSPLIPELYSTPLYNDPNLVAYYRLNGNSNDSKGSNNGTDTSITYSSGNGKFGQGAGFNGTSSKIDLANNVNLRFTGPFTISVWIKSTSTQENTIFSNLNTTSGGLYPYGGYDIVTRENTGYPNLLITDGINGTGINVTGNINVCDGAYHLLTFVFTGTEQKIYIDSVENASRTTSVAPGYLANSYPKIGVWYSDRLGYNYWYSGNIDDLALFNRALTPTEISRLYTGDWSNYGPAELYSTPLYNDSGLVSYYRLNGNSNDAKGSNNGTDTSITYSVGNGRFDQGAGFDGANSKITLNASTFPSGAGTRTMMAWVKLAASPTSGKYWPIIGYGTGDYYKWCALRYTNDGGTYKFGFAGYGADYDPAYTLTEGVWHLVAVTYDGTYIRLYADGSLVGAATPITLNTSGSDGFIGKYPTASGYQLNGSIDDATIFNRALTPTEISNLYSGNWGTSTSTPYDHVLTYSPTGNILSKSDQGSYTYNGNNYTNPQAVTSIGTSTSVTYDNNGNILSYNTVASSTSYTWNYRNELLDATTTGTSTVYMYNQSGDRVKYYAASSTNPIRTVYYPNKYYEYDAVSGKATTHVYLLGQPIATIETTGTSTPNVFYIHRDHLGGTAVVTDGSGNLAQALDYYPFGDTRLNLGTHRETKTFDSYTFDSEADLLYLGARYYRGQTGRFFSEDPVFVEMGGSKFNDILLKNQYQLKNPFVVAVINNNGLEGNSSSNNDNLLLYDFLSQPQRLNSYSYVLNNPLAYTDPNGETPAAEKVVNAMSGRGFKTDAQLANPSATHCTISSPQSADKKKETISTPEHASNSTTLSTNHTQGASVNARRTLYNISDKLKQGVDVVNNITGVEGLAGSLTVSAAYTFPKAALTITEKEPVVALVVTGTYILTSYLSTALNSFSGWLVNP